MKRALLLLAAVLVAMPAQAQAQNDDGFPVIRLTTTKSVRTTYRVALDVLHAVGYRVAIKSLDTELRTHNLRADGQPARALVRIVFEKDRDSTAYVVMVLVPDSTGRAICRTDNCLTQVLAAEETISGAIETGLNSLPARGRTMGDSLAAAGAYGYTPETAIRVRGPGDPDATDAHDYLNSLRGPGGERVGWQRLGSCCAFSTPNGLGGRGGMLDAYEVVYPGQPAPVTLYLNMYDPPNRTEVPHGFTRVTPGPPST
ncbi:MAG TPA: hypothetical protein VFS20_11945 [Longimicrobium sp.]|nr:hypothetical protein [Longimicrobium sp.]